MNRNLWKLCRISAIEQFGINDLFAKNMPEKRRRAILMMAVYAFLAVMIGGYAYALGYGLAFLGLSDVIPAYALTITALLSFFLTVLKAGGVLFSFQDYELLTSLPIPTKTIVASRFAVLYFLNLIGALVIMGPMGAAYAAAVLPGAGFYPVWIAGIILATLIPTTLACVVGAVLVAVSSRFRHTNLVMVILTFAFLALFFVGTMFLSSSDPSNFSMERMSQVGSYLERQLSAIYLPAVWFSAAVVKQRILSLLLFAMVSLIWYFLFAGVLTLRYRSINSNLRGHYAKGNYRVTEMKQRSILMALYRKEWKRFLSCPIYVINMGAGIFMAILMTVIFVVVGTDKMMVLFEVAGYEPLFRHAAPFAVSIALSMSCSTCVSLSLEGKQLWQLQSLPVPMKKIWDSKILVNLTMLLPASLLCSFLLLFRMRPGIAGGLLYLAVPFSFAVFTAVMGMYVNIKLPKYNWSSETIVVKQSASAFIGLLGGPLLGIVCLIVILMCQNFAPDLVSLGICILLWGISLLLYSRMNRLEFL